MEIPLHILIGSIFGLIILYFTDLIKTYKYNHVKKVTKLDEGLYINIKFKDIGVDLPIGESLKDVIKRLNPFWIEYSNKIMKMKNDNLIVAHSNSLRAIVKILDKLSDEEIMSVNIPTGVPLVYSFDNNFNIIHKEYLIDEDKLKEKQKIVANQGKAK